MSAQPKRPGIAASPVAVAVAVDGLDERDRAGPGQGERQRGVVGLVEQPVLERRRVREQDDPAFAGLLDEGDRTVLAGRQRQRAAGVLPDAGLRGAQALGGAGLGSGHQDARARLAAVVPARRVAAGELGEPVARLGAARDDAAAALGEPAQRPRLAAREALRVEHHHRPLGRQRGVGRPLAQPPHLGAGAVEQLGPGGHALAARSRTRTRAGPRGSGGSASIATVTRLTATTTADGAEREPALAAAGQQPHASTSAQPRRACSASSCSAGRPPYAIASKRSPTSRKAGDSTARATSPVVSDGR